MATMSTILQVEDFRTIVSRCPIIDNHAHNLLRPSSLRTHDLRTITTEATGDALVHSTHSLSHHRALRQLRQLYKTSPDADWEAVKAKRLELLDEDAHALIKQCLDGTQTILVDDGFGNPDEIEAFGWHDEFTNSPCKRIVRIETVAANIMSGMYRDNRLPVGVAIASEDSCTEAWRAFLEIFEAIIADCLADPDVVGFKSVICYRTGLDIQVGGSKDAEATQSVVTTFQKHYLPSCKVKAFRIAQKQMNDALVLSTCNLLAAHLRQTHKTKAFQFHTGLGDNDISLLKSNPAYLQPLIEAFPSVPIVLLHSSYPYTREAGYLATVYNNVYLDVGEVFPMLSRDGQEKVVQQALELTPTTRILWSTDGHHFPETYYLANIQGRQALEKVISSYIAQDDLTVEQAAQAVCDILYNNANQLYNLALPVQSPATLVATPSLQQDIIVPELLSPIKRPKPIAPATTEGPPVVRNADRSMTPAPNTQNLVALDTSIELYFVQWIDYLGTLRTRCIPSREFHRLGIAGELRFSISYGNLGTLQNDGITPVVHPIGQLFVHPDLTSLKRMTSHGKIREHAATVMSSFYAEDGKPHGMCPRRTLSAIVSRLKHEHKLSARIGFEIECVFYKRDGNSTFEPFKPLGTNHAWSTFTAEQYLEAFPLVIRIHKALQDIGIHIQQMHAESGPGQYEFVLPPAHPISAIDTLYQARQCIQQVAVSDGLRVTFHASPFSHVGNASHVHVSFRSSLAADVLETRQLSFMAGVLDHLPALCAFTLPEAPSYDRVKDSSWTSGSWVAWGTQNREVPLRRVAYQDCSSQRWELRCIDGMPNMYLALAVFFTAGMIGIEDQLTMRMKDLSDNPANLTPSDRAALGISQRLPATLNQALDALQHDERILRALPHISQHYRAMKLAEQEFLETLPEHERRVWLMERY